MHTERPMRVRKFKKFRNGNRIKTHDVTHSHFPMTLNKLELSDVLNVGSWERVRAVLDLTRNSAPVIVSKGQGVWFPPVCCTSLMVNGELQDDRHFKLLLGFSWCFLSLRAWWSSHSVCFLPNWSATPSSTGSLSTSQMLVSIYKHHFTIKIT